MAKMRALELKRPVIFASNDGITAIIDANGHIESAIPAHQIAVLTHTVQPMQGLTPWMRFGMDPLLFITLYLLLYPIRLLRFKAAAKTSLLQPNVSSQR
jgi:apolipoprotein N-acyltransferase